MKVMWQTILGVFHQNDRDPTFPYYEGRCRGFQKIDGKLVPDMPQINFTEMIGGSTKTIGNQFWPNYKGNLSKKFELEEEFLHFNNHSKVFQILV